MPQPQTCAIIGAGHAGTEAADQLAQNGVAVTLYSNEPRLPYYRPRLIAAAFGQANLNALAIHPQAWYDQRGIQLKLNTPAAQLDPAAKTVNGTPYDAILIAAGARPVRPGFPGNANDAISVLWDHAHATAIAARLQAKPKLRLLIIGGGLLGLETAFRAADARCIVTILEKLPTLLNGRLGALGTETLGRHFTKNNITLRTGVTIQSIQHQPNQTLRLTTEDGQTHEADLILNSIGAAPDLQQLERFGLKADRGILVDEHLQTPYAGVYAAGDIAQPPNSTPRCVVRYALLQGKLAAQNILGQNQVWTPPALPLFMSTTHAQFHLYGDTTAEDTQEQRLDDGSDPYIYRAIVKRGEKPIALRMVGTRDQFDTLAATIKP